MLMVLALHRLVLARCGGSDLCNLPLGSCSLNRGRCGPALVGLTLLAVAAVMWPALTTVAALAISATLGGIAAAARTPDLFHLLLGRGVLLGCLRGSSRVGLDRLGFGFALIGSFRRQRRGAADRSVGGDGIGR